MNSVDLLWLLKEFDYKLEKVTVFGKIERKINKPANFKDNVRFDDGVFMEMHLFAVDLSYYVSYLKERGIDRKIFLVNGSIAVYVPSRGKVYPDFYTTTGTLRLNNNYVYMFNWHKNDAGWCVFPSVLDNIEVNNYVDDKFFYNILLANRETGNITLPQSVYSLKKFYAEPTSFVENESLNKKLEQVINGVEIKPANTESCGSLSEISRKTIASKSPIYDRLINLTIDAHKKRQSFVDDLVNKYAIEHENGHKKPSIHIRNMLHSLKTYLTSRPSGFGSTGRRLIKDYLSEFPNADKKYLGEKCSDILIDYFYQIADFIEEGTKVNIEGNAWELCKTAFGDAERMFASIASNIIGVDMRESQKLCSDMNISFSELLYDNPYALQLIGGFNFSEVELIAMCVGKSTSKDIEEMRNIAILNAYITGSDYSDTAFNVNSLSTKNIGAKLTKRQYELCSQKGNYLGSAKETDVKTYLTNGTAIKYNITSYIETKAGYEQRIPANMLNTVINNYISTGLGVIFDNYITSAILLKKELVVYNFFYELGSTPSGLKSDDIDKCILEYEKIVGFPLEKEQREAVHLLEWKAGVVSGCAGSGKTTTSNCFVYTKEKLDPTSELKFATPTGKAAKRMQEVIKRPVKTMCSLFKTWQSTDRLFDKTDRESDIGTKNTFLFDECAMVTIDLLYSCVIKISDSEVYLFGDFHQLPPIGKGLPFKNLLRFMPCVFLKVSKRAAEGSEITLNSDYINNNSTHSNWKSLESGKDFMLTPCAMDEIQNVVKGIVSHYLGKSTNEEDKKVLHYMGYSSFPDISELTPDDIQVASPVGKANYSWGCTQLNSILQPLFNTTRGYNNTFAFQVSKNTVAKKFVIGDRVLHSVGNMYSMQWYSTYKNGVFKKTYGFGACNGDVGKIVAFMPADGCEFEDEDGLPPDGFEYPSNIRDDSSYTGSDCWFVVVQYYDFMEEENYYILYRCKELYDTDVTFGKAFNGEDLARLDLFYAGTIHKLQGSQYKLVLCPLGDDLKSPTFLTRNLFYTAYTRGINLVIPIGSVSNSMGSALSRARTSVADSNTLTIGEILGK